MKRDRRAGRDLDELVMGAYNGLTRMHDDVEAVEDSSSPQRHASWVSPGLSTQPSRIHGRGLFTHRPISKNEVVVRLGGVLFRLEDVRAGRVNSDSVTGFSDDLYLGPRPAPTRPLDEYINHSCDPNVWLSDATTLIARHAIAAGDELTVDYATWEIDENWRFPPPCTCGAGVCRTVITGQDWRKPVLQRRYAGHFLPCLEARIRRLTEGSDFEEHDKVYGRAG